MMAPSGTSPMCARNPIKSPAVYGPQELSLEAVLEADVIHCEALYHSAASSKRLRMLDVSPVRTASTKASAWGLYMSERSKGNCTAHEQGFITGCKKGQVWSLPDLSLQRTAISDPHFPLFCLTRNLAICAHPSLQISEQQFFERHTYVMCAWVSG